MAAAAAGDDAADMDFEERMLAYLQERYRAVHDESVGEGAAGGQQEEEEEDQEEEEDGAEVDEAAVLQVCVMSGCGSCFVLNGCSSVPTT
jgi:hypothetical protein